LNYNRGARQVGKTFANMVEINFERTPNLAEIFDRDLDPRRIVRDLVLACNQPIEPGKTLLFFDEIQQAPRALTFQRACSARGNLSEGLR